MYSKIYDKGTKSERTTSNMVQGLLSRPPETEEDEPITQVLPPLEIKRGPLDINEYKRASGHC